MVRGVVVDVPSLLLGEGPALPGAGRLGRRMAALYGVWAQRGLDLVALASCMLDRLGGAGTPAGRTCLALARAVARWGGHAYHSAGHHAEVAANADLLAQLGGRLGEPITPGERTLLLAAALAHDLDYDPQRQPKTRFAAEAASAASADALAAGCGMDMADRGDLRVLILATEPGSRPCVRSPGGAADLPAPLRPLASRPDLARLAAVLSDADLLSSAGLTEHWHGVQRGRLERELRCGISAADDMVFFDRIVGEDFLSPGGRHFTPNLRRIRQSVQDAALASRPAGKGPDAGR